MIKLNPITGNLDDVGFPARTITGTTNQITVTNGDGVAGNPTLALPQDIHTGASPTFAGVIASVTDKGGQVFNVKAYGAVGDGITDDLTAIRATITAATTSGGTVFFPAGIYIISNYLAIPSNVWLVGAGEASVIKQKASSNVNAIIRGTGQISNSGLDSLMVDYNHANNASCSQGMAIGSESSYITIKNCHFKNAKGFAISFTGTPTSRNNHITVTNNLVTDPLATNNDMVLVVSDYGTVTNNRVIGCTANVSIFLYESDHMVAYGNTVELAAGTGERPSGIYLGSCRYSQLYGNKVVGAGTTSGTAYAILTEHDNASPISSSNNLVYGNYAYNIAYGINIVQTSYDQVLGNSFNTINRAFYFSDSAYANSDHTLLADNYLTTVTTPVYDTTTGTVATYTFRDNFGYAAVGDSAIKNVANTFTANQTINGDIPFLALKTTQAGIQEWRWVSGYNDAASVTLLDVTGGNVQKVIIDATNMKIADNTAPMADSTYTLGTSALYWSSTYTDRLYLNATAYIDGATAGNAEFTGKLTVGGTQSANAAVSQEVIKTSSGAEAFALQLRNSATANNTATTLRFKSSTDGTTADDSGASQISSIRTNSPGAGDTEMAFEVKGAEIFRIKSVGISITEAKDIVLGTTTGTKIGTGTTQKLGFFNATPVVQPSSTPANATDLATALTLVNDLKSKLVTLGLIA